MGRRSDAESREDLLICCVHGACAAGYCHINTPLAAGSKPLSISVCHPTSQPQTLDRCSMSTIPPPTQSPHERIFAVPEAVLKGTMMTKVSEKRQKRVLFQLDPDAGSILYKSRKTGPGQY